MKSPDEIRARLAELKADERLAYPLASIEVNAPLALIQLAGGASVVTLEWVLGLKPSKFPLKKKKS